MYNILSSDDAAFLAEYVPANILLKYQDKQQVLNESTLMRRISTLLELLNRECQVLSIEKEIQDKVSDQMDKNQRDYYLREQMRVIATELDETEDARLEAEEYRKKIEAPGTARGGRGKASERDRADGPACRGKQPGSRGDPHLSGTPA